MVLSVIIHLLPLVKSTGGIFFFVQPKITKAAKQSLVKLRKQIFKYD